MGLAYTLLLTFAVAAAFFGYRAAKRASAATPAAGLRSAAQRQMHFASIALLLLSLAYFAMLSDFGIVPFFAVLAAQVVVMFLLRSFNVRWQVRAWLTPAVAISSLFAGVLAIAWPSTQLLSVPPSGWYASAAAAVVTGASTILSMLSFPIGYGERAR